MVNVFTIIVTYNGSRWVNKCVESLLNSTLPVKVIVIDNGSIDDTRVQIRNKFPQVDLTESSINLGFGRANNIGIKKAYRSGATHLFLLNQDAWVERGTIERLVAQQQENTEYGVLSPIHLNGGGDALDLDFSTYIIPLRCPGLYSDLYLNKIRDRVYEVDFVNAAAWLISRACIEKVGGFNPSFFQYGEDDNYIHRVRYFGFKTGIYPFSKIFHDRENRNKGIFEDDLEKFKRKNLLKYSNPLQKYSPKRDGRRLIISAAWQLLQGRVDLFKHSWKQYKIVKETAQISKKNFFQSIKGGSLCFLDS